MSHLLSGGVLLVIQQWKGSGQTNPFCHAHVSMQVSKPHQLNSHISNWNVNCSSWHVWNLNLFLTNIIVFSLKLILFLIFWTKLHGWYLKETYFSSLAMYVLNITTRLTCFYCSSSHIGTEVNVFFANLGQTLIGSFLVGEWAGFATSGEFRFYQLSVTEVFIKYQT